MERYVRKVYRWTEGTSAHLNVGFRQRCVIGFMLWLLCPSTYRMGGWVFPTDSMDTLAKANILLPICNQTQGVANCPAHFNVCVSTLW